LIAGTYEEMPIEPSVGNNLFYLVQVVSWNQLMMVNFDSQEYYSKGLVLAVCLHALCFFFMLGILRVKLTEAGRVSEEWVNEIN
jgi:hypothetical protein